MDDSLFDKLKKSVAAPYIKVVKELNVDFVGKFIFYFFLIILIILYKNEISNTQFLAFEQQIFTLEQPLSPFHLYNPGNLNVQNLELSRIAKRVSIHKISYFK